MIDQKDSDKLNSILDRGWIVNLSKDRWGYWGVVMAPTLCKMNDNEWLCCIGLRQSLYDVLCIVENMILDRWDEMYSDLPKDLFQNQYHKQE